MCVDCVAITMTNNTSPRVNLLMGVTLIGLGESEFWFHVAHVKS